MAIEREALLATLRELADAAPLPAEDEDIIWRVGRRIADAQARSEGSPTVRFRTGTPPLQFDWSLNLGHLLTILTILGGFTVAYGNYTSRVTGIEQSIEQANLRASRYIPVIEASTKANDVQDERIQNLSVALQELRRIQAEQLSILGNIREDMALVRARLSIERRVQVPSR